jgi:hypothetical protein
VKPVPPHTYRILCGAIVIALALCLVANRYFSAFDNTLLHDIRGWKCAVLDYCCAAIIEPKTFIPLYNLVLIVLYLNFPPRFTEVVLGFVPALFVAWCLSECSAHLANGNAGYLSPGSLTDGRFSHHYVAMVSAMVTYLCILFYGRNKWLKVLAIVGASTIPFSCIYMGTLLPFSALTATLAGILTSVVISPIYIRQVLLREPVG